MVAVIRHIRTDFRWHFCHSSMNWKVRLNPHSGFMNCFLSSFLFAPVTPGGTDSPPHLPPWGNNDFLINELNTDTPGVAEDGEYIELWHPSGHRVSLQGIWILLFSALNNKPYREISLSGHFTTSKGYFLLGSDRLVPAPSLRLPPNTIQNGPDAVALYRSPFGPPSATQRGIPTKGLLDAVVYRQRGSDREALELSKALTPGQLPLLEDQDVLSGDEALSRCRGLYPYDLSAFSVSCREASGWAQFSFVGKWALTKCRASQVYCP